MANTSLTQALHRGASQRPNEIAVVFGARRRSYAELKDRVARLASALRSLGLEPGNRIGMLALNSDRYVEYYYSSWWAGGVANPVNVRWSAREIAYSLDDCDTRILLVDQHFQDRIPELLKLSRSLQTVIYVGDGAPPTGMLDGEGLIASARPCSDACRSDEDLAAVLYTGGTPGLPKGAMLTHANLYINGLNTLATIPRTPESVCALGAPMFHVAGAGLMLQLMIILGRQVILPSFDEAQLLRAIHEERATEVFLVPTMLKRLLDHPTRRQHDLSSLRTVLYGASPIDSTLLRQALEALPQLDFWHLYGMTELSSAVTALRPQYHRLGSNTERLRSAGVTMPAVELRIVDSQGLPVSPGIVGEITVRGPCVMAGYWNKPAETTQAIRDGWMHTGDGGRLDADGFLYVVDRMKDMIVTGGENVYSAEVENAITQLPAVSQCAVIGVPDEHWGERVHAVVVLKPGAQLTDKELIAHCRELIASYKCPRSVDFKEALPLSAAGKILKYKLREPLWAGRDRGVA